MSDLALKAYGNAAAGLGAAGLAAVGLVTAAFTASGATALLEASTGDTAPFDTAEAEMGWHIAAHGLAASAGATGTVQPPQLQPQPPELLQQILVLAMEAERSE